jgi:dolichol kinase
LFASVVDRRHLARRALHVAVSLAVLYYWFPERVVELGLSKQEIAVIGVALMAAVEAVRLRRKAIVFPMRDYERGQIAGHLWFVFGCLVALLFFPQRFAMITILGTALVDPLEGEIRGRESVRKYAEAAGFAAWCAVAFICILAVPLATPLVLVPLGAALAVLAEAKKIKLIDDNFLMNIVPLLGLTAAAALAGL